MKEMLKTEIDVRVSHGDHVHVEKRTIRDIIVNPSGIHADDVLNATRIMCAEIILQFESEEA